MFVFIYRDVFLLCLHCSYLLSQPALRLCVRSALLTAPSIGVLTGAGDAMLTGKIVGRLHHRIDAIARLHDCANATPSESTILQFLLATEGSFGLGYDERRPRHAFDAPGNHQLCTAVSDCPSRLTNCILSGSGPPVHP